MKVGLSKTLASGGHLSTVRFVFFPPHSSCFLDTCLYCFLLGASVVQFKWQDTAYCHFQIIHASLPTTKNFRSHMHGKLLYPFWVGWYKKGQQIDSEVVVMGKGHFLETLLAGDIMHCTFVNVFPSPFPSSAVYLCYLFNIKLK